MKKNLSSAKKAAPTVINSLSQSSLFSEYQRAFSDTTGLSLGLLGADSIAPPFSGQRTENPFCAMVARSEEGCLSCLKMQKDLASQVGVVPVTLECFAGLTHTVIPVKSGDKILGCLHTGAVFLGEPSRKNFNRIVQSLLKWGMKTDVKRVESAYFGTRVLTQQQYDAMLRLLGVFAKHLSEVSNRIVVEATQPLSPMIQTAQEYIREHQTEPMTLTDVATSVNVGAQYFSSLFHEATGITFTDYVARVRVEQARAMLANPQNRISEVAFAVGFDSLSQFNRVFRRVVGTSPTQYRASLPQAKPSA